MKRAISLIFLSILLFASSSIFYAVSVPTAEPMITAEISEQAVDDMVTNQIAQLYSAEELLSDYDPYSDRERNGKQESDQHLEKSEYSSYVTAEDAVPPVIIGPDDFTIDQLEYAEIVWYLYDEHAIAYEVWINGEFYTGNLWTGPELYVTQIIQSWDPGVYEYTILAISEVENATDTVYVTVNQIYEYPEVIFPDDITYTERELGNDLTFILYHEDPTYWCAYLDSYYYGAVPWTQPNETVILNVDNLSVGVHQLVFSATGSEFFNTTGIVTITVLEQTGYPEIIFPGDITYFEGETGNDLTFILYDENPVSWTAELDGAFYTSGPWTEPNMTVIINVDGLSVGLHELLFTAWGETSATGIVWITVDSHVLIIYGPDYISINEGELGWTIDWEIYGSSPGYYWVYQDGEVLFGGQWDYSGYMVSVNLDWLPGGNHIFELDVGDSNGNQLLFTTFVDVLWQGQGIEIYGPDYISFNDGELGWTIDWEIYGTAPGHYWVYQNGELQFEGDWDYSGYIVTVDLDGVPLGNYIYQLFVDDANYASGYYETYVDIWSPFPMIIGPEEPIYLMYGDTGYSIMWEIFDINPLHYEVVRYHWGVSIETIIWETWWDNTTVAVSLDGLSPGQYTFSLEAVGLYNTAFSQIEVYVGGTGPSPIIQGPESYEFTAGEIGQNLTYSIYDETPFRYLVRLDGFILLDEWCYESETEITINLDYLSVGVYSIDVSAMNELGLIASWITMVTVNPQPEYILHDPIWIETDFDFEYYASAEGWSGDGSASNPFVIENYVFMSYELCLYIGHTNYHYIIRNCVFSSTIGYGSAGVVIQSAPNGIIEFCHFYTSQSMQIDYSDGIVIMNNEFHGRRMDYGLFIGYSQFVTVEDNVFFDFSGAMYVVGCNQANIVNNTVSNCGIGILLSLSIDCFVAWNTFDSGGIYINGYSTDGYWHNTFLDNYMNGRLIGFFFDLDGVSVDVSEYAQLLVFNCTYSEFYNGFFERATCLVTIVFSHSCIVSNLTLIGGSLLIDRSHDCAILDIICNDRSNIVASQSQNLIFFGCTIVNAVFAYQLYETESVLISWNTISNCEEGIQLQHCTLTTITNSSFISNVMAIDDVYNMGTAVYNCIFENNTRYGIYVSQSENAIIDHSTFYGNYFGIFIQYSLNCYIYQNQFFSSSKAHAYDYGPYPSNFWDDGMSVGNAWDDYEGTGWYYIPGHGLGVDHFPCSTSVPTAPTLDSPVDISFLEGQYSGSIVWNVFDDNRDYYEVWLNGYLITQTNWMPDEIQVFVELAGLTPGTYEYTLILYDEDGLNTSDTVTVTVYPDTTPPEFQYYWGTLYYFRNIDNFVVWGIYDQNPLYYEIYADGVLIGIYEWNEATFEVVLNVDGLEVGVHQYELTIYAIGGSASAWVEVIVLPDTIPVVTSPEDITCYYESTNNAITWEVTDPYLSYYLVMMNGVYYEGGAFTSSSELVTVNIDGLDLGVYEFTILVSNDGANTTDTVIVTVMTVPHHVESYLTNNDDKVISTFDIMFKKACEGYELFHTIPNKMVYNIEFINIWPYDLGTLTFSVNIPADFCLRGDSPIIVYVDEIDVTASASIIGTQITVFNIAAGSHVTIRIMIDYALKGLIFESLEDFLLRSYWFDVETSESGETIIIHDHSKSSLVSHQKHVTAIAGLVTDTNFIPIVGALVELYDSAGNLIANTVTDSDGFYYFIEVDAGLYTVILHDNDTEYDSVAEAVNNQMTLVEFIILEER